MIRVHLNAEDLLRIRYASHPAPLIELGHALAALHRSDPAFTGWRRHAWARLPRTARPLLDLIPGSATGPLFLDPISTSVEEGLQLVRQAPPAFITAELQRITGTTRPPSRVRMLAEQDRQSWRDLIRAQRLAHQSLIADSWPQVWGGFRAERAWRGRLMAELGIQGALATLHPSIDWDATVLQIRTPKELDFYPRGAGVTLLPSVFWTGRPQIGHHPDGSVVIVYPALAPLPILQQAPSDHGNPLGALLGPPRCRLAADDPAAHDHRPGQRARDQRCHRLGSHKGAESGRPYRHHPRREGGAAFGHPAGQHAARQRRLFLRCGLLPGRTGFQPCSGAMVIAPHGHSATQMPQPLQ